MKGGLRPHEECNWAPSEAGPKNPQFYLLVRS